MYSFAAIVLAVLVSNVVCSAVLRNPSAVERDHNRNTTLHHHHHHQYHHQQHNRRQPKGTFLFILALNYRFVSYYVLRSVQNFDARNFFHTLKAKLLYSWYSWLYSSVSINFSKNCSNSISYPIPKIMKTNSDKNKLNLRGQVDIRTAGTRG